MMYTVSFVEIASFSHGLCIGRYFSLQGTTTEQDNRFSDKEKKLLKQMKFGDCLSQRVSFFFFIPLPVRYGSYICSFVRLICPK